LSLRHLAGKILHGQQVGRSEIIRHTGNTAALIEMLAQFPDPDWFDQTPTWKAPKIQLDHGHILVLEST
jgi:hypothetical protein